ncbi:MAG: T9SS type A sorting domain-containing protein [Bacteroidia bacterium]
MICRQEPSTECYETATFNTTTCSWDVTGDMPVEPETACYETATFNTQTCSWDVTGEMPVEPEETACYETATFNTGTDVQEACMSYTWIDGNTYTESTNAPTYLFENGSAAGCDSLVTLNLTIIPQPEQPETACYQTATFNPQTCSWDVTGEMPAQPELACYQSAEFNTTTCVWDVTGEQPAQPEIACYESASFNNSTCSWDVTGDMPVEPETACYESASFNTTTCSWDVTGEMPAEPSTECYETATFNTQTCSWDVTGDMPVEPETACYESASFNTTTCSWDVTGDMPVEPETACYETATFNTQTCSWDVTGDMPAEPSTECYETATFNTTTCSWDVTGDMPAEPSTECYETATFNTQTCSWDVTGEMPVEPETACYETATFNTTTCSWDVTGEQPTQPEVSCYEYSVFNTQTCEWDIFGGQPPMPELACYESAEFNSETCQWDVTGEMPVEPSTECYETATFNTTTCSWDVTGDMPVEPETACYETATFNTQTCSWDVTGDMPVEPETACYETATFNTQTCSWDVTGEMPVEPETACYETATFNTTTCSWDVTGDMPAEPETACYETATFNSETCSWDVTGSPADTIVTVETVCDSYTWAVNGETYTETGIYFYSSDCQDYKLDLTVNYTSAVTYLSETINEGESFSFDGNDLTEAGVYEATFENAGGCDSLVILTLDVIPQVEGCVGATVYNSNQGFRKDGNAVLPERSITSRVLGAADAQNPSVNAPEQFFFSLGFGGSIEIDFGYNIANGPGNDIKIWESSASPNAEKARIEVSQDGLGYIPVGEVAQGGEVDFGGAFADYIRFVKIVDISNPADFSNSIYTDGYDVDAVECIHGRYVNPSCTGVAVVSVNQGKQGNGDDVIAERSDVNNALDMPVPAPVGTVDFYALGFGGEITLAFAGPVANGPGADIRVVETTWGYTPAEYPETANVFASQDGVNFVYLGSTVHSGEFDLGVLSWAQYIKIMDASDATLFPPTADGYDLNGIECLNGSADEPGDDGLIPCVLTDVLSYSPAYQKNGASINGMRNDPNKALGAPEGNDTYNFVSLGFGGSIELGFDFVVFNKPGDDIQIIETSFGNPSCDNYPEHAQVAGSIDGVSWVDLGELCLDGTMDLGSMTFLQFVKITDISNSASSKFGGTADGFDVDAVVVLGECYNAAARYAADNTTTPDESADMGLYPNPADDFTVIRLDGSIQDESLVVEIFDAAGRIVYTETVKANANQTNIRLNVVDFAKGVYTVSVSTPRERLVQRLVK